MYKCQLHVGRKYSKRSEFLIDIPTNNVCNRNVQTTALKKFDTLKFLNISRKLKYGAEMGKNE